MGKSNAMLQVMKLIRKASMILNDTYPKTSNTLLQLKTVIFNLTTFANLSSPTKDFQQQKCIA